MEKSNLLLTNKVEASANLFIKNAVHAQSKLLNKISEIVANAPDFSDITIEKRIAWYSGQLDKVNGMIQESGFADISGKYISEYKAFSEFAEKSFAAAGWDPAFAKISPEYVKFLKSRDLQYFNFLGKEAGSKISNTLFEMSIGGYTRGDMLKELKGVITGEYEWGNKQGLYEWHAGTYARTQAHRTQQAFMNYQAEKIKAEDYIYLGPLDAKTRPFCAALVGGVFTKEEIMEMENGQSGDVFSDGGGWNCRHQWLAVPKDVVESYVKKAA
jgi:hypothetical protein